MTSAISDRGIDLIFSGRLISRLFLSNKTDSGIKNRVDRNSRMIPAPRIQTAILLSGCFNAYTNIPQNMAVDIAEIIREYELNSTRFFIIIRFNNPAERL